MRIKVGKATSKYLGTLVFLLLFFLKETFPNAALAFTSLNACARSKECLELIKGSSSSAVSAPTGAGFGRSTLSTTISSGAVRTLVKGVTDFAIVTAPTAAYVGWHYWNKAHNGRAQTRARELYCAAYSSDEVCNSTQVVSKSFVEGYGYGGGCSTPTFVSLPIAAGQESNIESRSDNYCGPGGVLAYYKNGSRFNDTVFNGSFSIVTKNFSDTWADDTVFNGSFSLVKKNTPKPWKD